MFGPEGSGDTSGYGRLVREVAMPGSSPRPYGGYFDEVVDTLAAALGEQAFEAAVERVVVYRDQLTLEVRREHLRAVMQALRDDPGLRFELSLGVSGVHYPADSGRE
ncbi:MAG TPA: NADH-quinone oxidoreductase subunit C, partial [Mycobacterium sp.]|nr:NADH-quinone oxidoreductase subunit C [Mycobacterium sp.]